MYSPRLLQSICPHRFLKAKVEPVCVTREARGILARPRGHLSTCIISDGHPLSLHAPPHPSTSLPNTSYPGPYSLEDCAGHFQPSEERLAYINRSSSTCNRPTHFKTRIIRNVNQYPPTLHAKAQREGGVPLLLSLQVFFTAR